MIHLILAAVVLLVKSLFVLGVLLTYSIFWFPKPAEQIQEEIELDAKSIREGWGNY